MLAPWCAFTVWLVLFLILFAHPLLTLSPTLGDDLTRHTIRLALACYAGAATLLLLARQSDWKTYSPRLRLARVLWTCAWFTYLVHVAMAFHFVHGWSHAHAMRHTEAVSGLAEGIFVSHLFTLVWTADVLAWWSRPAWYADRPRGMDWLLHAFLGFVIFNGTIVFESGWIRWAGGGMFLWLAAVALWRLNARSFAPGRCAVLPAGNRTDRDGTSE